MLPLLAIYVEEPYLSAAEYPQTPEIGLENSVIELCIDDCKSSETRSLRDGINTGHIGQLLDN